MSIEISNNYSDYKTGYWERVQRNPDRSKDMSIQKDEYISSEKSSDKPSGLYHMGQDENGNPKVIYDDPKKTEKKESTPAKKSEECTTNIDKVDRKIEKLKEEKQQLEQQIRDTPDDTKKVNELKKKLVSIEAELSKKDNDTYRRQNSIVQM